MSEPWKITLTAIATIIGAVIIYTLKMLLIEPIQRLRSLIVEISYSLVFYANIYCNPGSCDKQRMDEASEALRRQASQLSARTKAIIWYPFWASIRKLPKECAMREASAELIGLSNSIHSGPPMNKGSDNHKKRQRIEQLLSIQTKS